MKVFNFTLIVLVAFTFWGCEHNNPTSPVIRDLSSVEKQIVEADNKFGFKLFKEINQADGDTNIFISPLSVSMALGMTLNGANGETQAAMEQTLEFAGLTTDEINQSYQSLIDLLTQLDPKVIFQIANSIWHRQSMNFEQEFLDRNRTYFDALVQELNFDDPNSVDTINDWVNENTNGKIEEIIDSIDPQIVMFLINAIYFNGTWTYEFDKELTRDELFNLPDGSQTPCKMMVQTSYFNYFENDDLQAVELPYSNGQFRMTVLLPKPTKDLDSFIGMLNNGTWDQIITNFSEDSLTLELPKFKLEYEKKLNDILDILGMGIAFTGAADFTRMYKPGGLFIDFVKHKTFIEVDEEGTEAAAVTIVGIRDSAGGPQMKFMRVDQGFLFVIWETLSGAIIFMGKVVEPLQ